MDEQKSGQGEAAPYWFLFIHYKRLPENAKRNSAAEFSGSL
ncbi:MULTISPECIES: hypothetical protein [Eikenella]|nr:MULTISPECIES: hypothetical protein [Eikenella]